jgi:hypothetical protein
MLQCHGLEQSFRDLCLGERVERGQDSCAFYGTKKGGARYREEWCERKLIKLLISEFAYILSEDLASLSNVPSLSIAVLNALVSLANLI